MTHNTHHFPYKALSLAAPCPLLPVILLAVAGLLVCRAAPAATESIGVHLETYNDFSRAELAVEVLLNDPDMRALGAGFVIAPVDLGGHDVQFRVIAGPYGDRASADETQQRLTRSGRYAMVVGYDPGRVTASIPSSFTPAAPQSSPPIQAPPPAPEPVAEASTPARPPLASARANDIPAPDPAPRDIAAQAPATEPAAMAPQPSSSQTPATGTYPGETASPGHPMARSGDEPRKTLETARPDPVPRISETPQASRPGVRAIPFTFLLDGTRLALSMTVLDDGRQLFLPLEALAAILDLEVYVDRVSGNAVGWIVDQDRTFKLIPGEERVELAGQPFDAPEELFLFLDGYLFVALPALERWFGLTLTPHHQRREILATPLRRLPIQVALATMPDSANTWTDHPRLAKVEGFIEPLGMHALLTPNVEFSVAAGRILVLEKWTNYAGLTTAFDDYILHAGLVPMIPMTQPEEFLEEPDSLLSGDYILVFMGLDVPLVWCEDDTPCPFGRRMPSDVPPRP